MLKTYEALYENGQFSKVHHGLIPRQSPAGIIPDQYLGWA